jgi:hypothetical protein
MDNTKYNVGTRLAYKDSNPLMIATIDRVDYNNMQKIYYLIFDDAGLSNQWSSYEYLEQWMNIIPDNIHSKSNIIKERKQSTMSKLKEKFILGLTKEPQKSFRKSGITNGDDMLTEEGTEIFLTWLLHEKFAEDFKKEVVDDILKGLKEEE